MATIKHYGSRSNALRAARQNLGTEAAEGKNFKIEQKGEKDFVLTIGEVAPAPAASVVALSDSKESVMAKTVNKRTAAKAAKRPAETETEAVEIETKGPKGLARKMIALALRDGGVTAEELNETSQWTGAAWKWLFSNSKGTGFADRWGFKLSVKKEGRTAYYTLRPSTKAAKALTEELVGEVA